MSELLTFKGVNVRDYELITIIKPDVTDEDATAIVDKVKAFIGDRKGEVSEVNPWGKKKLAYQIGQYKEGNYFLMRLKLAAKDTRELETSLKLNEKVMRHLLVKIEK
jgi:small subunit ribosomal protein S6